MAKKKSRKKTSSALISVLKSGLFILVILVIAYIVANYGFRRSVVHNVSMQNTLLDGDNIIMDEFTYHVSEPERYDVICFKSYKEKDLLIKRIIGLPGETVRIIDGVIYINDKEIRDIKGLKAPEYAGLAATEIKLDSNEYFVLGDNRAESIDSRYDEIGNVKRREILGKASLVIWPLNRIKVIE